MKNILSILKQNKKIIVFVELNLFFAGNHFKTTRFFR